MRHLTTISKAELLRDLQTLESAPTDSPDYRVLDDILSSSSYLQLLRACGDFPICQSTKAWARKAFLDFGIDPEIFYSQGQAPYYPYVLLDFRSRTSDYQTYVEQVRQVHEGEVTYRPHPVTRTVPPLYEELSARQTYLRYLTMFGGVEEESEKFEDPDILMFRVGSLAFPLSNNPDPETPTERRQRRSELIIYFNALQVDTLEALKGAVVINDLEYVRSVSVVPGGLVTEPADLIVDRPEFLLEFARSREMAQLLLPRLGPSDGWAVDNAAIQAAFRGDKEVVELLLSSRYVTRTTIKEALVSSVQPGNLETFRFLWSVYEQFLTEERTLFGTELLVQAAGQNAVDIFREILALIPLDQKAITRGHRAALLMGHSEVLSIFEGQLTPRPFPMIRLKTEREELALSYQACTPEILEVAVQGNREMVLELLQEDRGNKMDRYVAGLLGASTGDQELMERALWEDLSGLDDDLIRKCADKTQLSPSQNQMQILYWLYEFGYRVTDPDRTRDHYGRAIPPQVYEFVRRF